MSRAVIFANGELPDLEAIRTLINDDDCLIAADGGANYLLKMDLIPEIVLGDMDSLTDETLSELAPSEVIFEKYPVDKDETDFELALQYAIDLRPSAILVVGALGGRLDQTLTNISILTNPMLSGFDIRLDDGLEESFFCRANGGGGEQVEIRGRSGDTLSLIPWNGPVEGITTVGLQWPLYSETLYPYKTRGISNIMLDDIASIHIRMGLLLIIRRRQLY